MCGEYEGSVREEWEPAHSLLQWRQLTCSRLPCHLPSVSLPPSCSPPPPPHVMLRQWAFVSAPPRHLPTAPPAGHIVRGPSGGQTVPPSAPPPSPHTWSHRQWLYLSVSAALEGHSMSAALPRVTPASRAPLRELAPVREEEDTVCQEYQSVK